MYICNWVQPTSIFYKWRRVKGMEGRHKLDGSKRVEVLLWWARFHVITNQSFTSKLYILWHIWQYFAPMVFHQATSSFYHLMNHHFALSYLFLIILLNSYHCYCLFPNLIYIINLAFFCIIIINVIY